LFATKDIDVDEKEAATEHKVLKEEKHHESEGDLKESCDGHYDCKEEHKHAMTLDQRRGGSVPSSLNGN